MPMFGFYSNLNSSACRWQCEHSSDHKTLLYFFEKNNNSQVETMALKAFSFHEFIENDIIPMTRPGLTKEA